MEIKWICLSVVSRTCSQCELEGISFYKSAKIQCQQLVIAREKETNAILAFLYHILDFIWYLMQHSYIFNCDLAAQNV